MERERAVILVEVDLDPVLGSFNVVEDFVNLIQNTLDTRVPHYNPSVKAAEKRTIYISDEK